MMLPEDICMFLSDSSTSFQTCVETFVVCRPGKDGTKEACVAVSGFLGRAHLPRGDWLALGLFENASAFRASRGLDA